MERQPQRTFQIVQEKTPTRCEICHQDDQFDPVANLCRRCSLIDVVQLNESLTVQNEEPPPPEIPLPTPSLHHADSLETQPPYPSQPHLSSEEFHFIQHDALNLYWYDFEKFLRIQSPRMLVSLSYLVCLALLAIPHDFSAVTLSLFFFLTIGVVFPYYLNGRLTCISSYVARDAHVGKELQPATASSLTKSRHWLVSTEVLSFDGAFVTFSALLWIFAAIFALVAYLSEENPFIVVPFFTLANLWLGVKMKVNSFLTPTIRVFEKAKGEIVNQQSMWLTEKCDTPILGFVLLEELIYLLFWGLAIFLVSLLSEVAVTPVSKILLTLAFYHAFRVPWEPYSHIFRTLLYVHLRSRAEGHPLQLRAPL